MRTVLATLAMRATMTKKLSDLKAGDKVLLLKYCCPMCFLTVDRVTKAQLIIGDEKYNRETGFCIPAHKHGGAFQLSVNDDDIDKFHEQIKDYSSYTA